MYHILLPLAISELPLVPGYRLMKTRAIPKVGEGIPIATTEAEASQLFVDDGSIDAIKLKPGDSPTFYTILLFAHGFYTYFYKVPTTSS